MESRRRSDRFWRLDAPDYDSDSQQESVNGVFDRTHGMPGIRCGACGQIWGASHVMPFPCPAVMRGHPSLLDRRPISPDADGELRERVLSELRLEGVARDLVADAIRGDFMGGTLRIGSPPRVDFLWAALGSFFVSRRVRGVMLDVAPGAVVTAPVPLATVGPGEDSPRPTDGEPEYFEVVPLRESGPPPGADVVSRCAACGREKFDETRRHLVMQPRMWRGDPIFRLATTLWVVVTDEFRVTLEQLGATNVSFVPIEAGNG